MNQGMWVLFAFRHEFGALTLWSLYWLNNIHYREDLDE